MAATHRKSIIRESLDRLDAKMAIGESRREAKQAIRETQGPTWSVSDEKIHSYKTRTTYQEHALKFVAWARDTHGIKRLEDLDTRAQELANEWIGAQVAEGKKSAYTLQVTRSALRMFFGRRDLAQDVPLPRRSRERITRSRKKVGHDKHFQAANWQPLLHFLSATGVRRQELRDLRCRDVYTGLDRQLYVHIASGKGGRQREVPVLPGHEQDVLTLVEDRYPDDPLCPRIPKHLDVHSYRREFAQAFYLYHAPGRMLPPATGRLKQTDYDRDAALMVTQALGHNRIDVVLRHYIR